MGLPLPGAAALLLLLLPLLSVPPVPPAGAAVPRLRVSANFVSTGAPGGGREKGRGKQRGRGALMAVRSLAGVPGQR